MERSFGKFFEFENNTTLLVPVVSVVRIDECFIDHKLDQSKCGEI